MTMELPKEIQIGGQILKTQICEELGGKLGKCCCYNGYIKIATNVDGSIQTESSIVILTWLTASVIGILYYFVSVLLFVKNWLFGD